MKRAKTILVFLLSALVVFESFSQIDTTRLEVLGVSGDYYENNFSGQQYNYSWTLGETVIETKGDARYFITQGFHQSHWNVVAVWEYVPELVEMKLYPNPMAEYLTLSFPEIDELDGEYYFKVFDLLAKPIFEAEVVGTENRYNLNYLPNGTYLMNVIKRDGSLVKSFKVIKNQ